ncbi:DUF4298 domain-containing protein [Butyrivibrio sp. MC2013]|uniref:DUF4298 domain-containing protein n=1 Tax=Butyrivibrio sp. MC2013 TaxID=1280686 RepID=UPI000424AFA3|nr:DUF4298 domain-containing protein [Butyrivibrio sp. MC2013]
MTGSKNFKRISDMEKLYDDVLQAQDSLYKAIEYYKGLQPGVKKLERYYSGRQWKDDFAADEIGEIPADIKRGVLSEDGLYDLLENDREIMNMLGRGL